MATPTTLPSTFVAGNVLTAAQMNNLRGAFRILQVVSTTKTDIFSSSQATGGVVDVTGLSATITPSATSSKILIVASVSGTLLYSATYYPSISVVLKRGGSAIGGGTTAGSRVSTNGSSGGGALDTKSGSSVTFNYLDSPATTSATTYQIAIHNTLNVTATIACNQFGDDANAANIARPSSTITLFEVSA